MSGLRLEAVSKTYGAVRALRSVTLDVPAGGRAAIVGPSGSGKTTLLRIVAGFEAPDSGRVTLDGEVLATGAATRPAHLRGVGIVAQDGALFPHLTVADNIGFGLSRSPARAGRIGELARLVGLDAVMLRRRPDELSGGQQQRAALARAMARQPRLMLLDEPFSALDAGLRASTRQAVAELLAAAAITTVLVTHDQAEALSFADTVAVLRDGEVLQAGTPQDLYYRPRSPEVAAFLGEAIMLPAHCDAGSALCALGRVPVQGPPHPATARILLRPEQVRIVPWDDASATPARITAVEFAGLLSLLTIELPGAGGTPVTTLKLRQASRRDLAAGMRVGIAVSGPAHIFPDHVFPSCGRR